ncbi:MAG TPA: RnfABCDGE type electron transport complex subunit B [Bacillota bacterium]|nr:RnfABCDGE type electron transport complex subunit B [Bacillota bacterium]HOA15190.1 RnfABCDGE type electron transport complex subunit B [Bacillota bacterium]HOG52750.1 RnfABCDGE type electron transport complex subunit B [Bacillota bacterium]
MILNGLLVVGGMGLVFGVALAIAAIFLAVQRDPKVDLIQAALPGANCGACGFPGCSGLATAIAEGKAPCDQCPVGGAKVAAKVAEIMCVVVDLTGGPKFARLMCAGGKGVARDIAEYHGISDCKAADAVSGGFKACAYGCLGLGECVAACPFDAMYMGEDGLPKIIDEKCTGCGKCVAACPRHLLVLRTADEKVNVICRSKAPLPKSKLDCSAVCIGCQICVKNCPTQAIHMEGTVAVIDNGKCTKCGICIQKCPVKCIHNSFGPDSDIVVQA